MLVDTDLDQIVEPFSFLLILPHLPMKCLVSLSRLVHRFADGISLSVQPTRPDVSDARRKWRPTYSVNLTLRSWSLSWAMQNIALDISLYARVFCLSPFSRCTTISSGNLLGRNSAEAGRGGRRVALRAWRRIQFNM